jgi:hypothetical protein
MGVIALSVSTLLVARAYAGERLKTEEARKAQARAVKSFLRAKGAVDLLTQISEEELDGIPPLRGIRRTLLDAALSYYQEFLDQAAEDPDAHPDLAVSHARVARLLAELSDLQGHAQLMWIANPEVQHELKTKPEQRQKIRQLSDKMTAEWGRVSATLASEDRQTKLAELAREQEREVAALLSSEQLKRLQQIGLQMRNQVPFSFRDPEIVAALKLTAKQQQDIRRIQEDALPMWGLPPDGPPPRKGEKGDKGPPPGGPGHKKGETMDRLQQRLLAVLTVEQRAQWREMIGEDFRPPKGPGKPPPKW